MAILVNGEPVAITDSAAERADTSYSFEVTGRATAEYRLTELDQADPAGRFRLLVTADQLLFQRAATADWATATTILTMDGAAGLILTPSFRSTVAATPVITATNVANAASVSILRLDGDRATPAADDEAFIELRLSDSAGNQTEFGRITWRGTTVTDGSETGRLALNLMAAGTITTSLLLFTPDSLAISRASGTANMTLTVENTSNAGANADQSIIDIRVGGTTTVGDPQIRWTVPGGTSAWYMGIDNSAYRDPIFWGLGTAVGSTTGPYIRMIVSAFGEPTPPDLIIMQLGTLSINSAAGGSGSGVLIGSFDFEVTTVSNTGSHALLELGQLSMTATAAFSLTRLSAIDLIVPRANDADATLTNGVGIRIRTAGAVTGALTNQYGMLIEDMTSGGTTDYGIAIEGADTACLWVSSAVDTTDAPNGIHFGLSRDVQLFRSAAGILSVERAGAVGLRASDTGTTGGASLTLAVGATSTTADPNIILQEGDGTGSANNMSYKVYYDSSANYFAIESRDSDGIGTDADIIRIPDGQLTVDGNSTFDANAFDYVCQQCGYHDAQQLSCPLCGHEMLWQDDSTLAHKLSRVIGAPQKTGGFNPGDAELLVKLGLLHRYEDGKLFIPYQTAHLFTFSAIAQLGSRTEAIEDQIMKLEADLKELRNILRK